MANSLLTTSKITREALRLFINSNAFIKGVNRDYQDEFAQTGAKIGTTLRIRQPNDYTVRTGKTAAVQDTNEKQTSLAVATQKGVDLSFSSADMALSLDDFSSRILQPAMNNLAGNVAADVMTAANGLSNMVYRDNGSGGIMTPDAATWLQAGAKLDINSAPRGRGQRMVYLDPLTQARTVSSLAGLFNPQTKISDQYETGLMSKDTLGADWYMDQTVIGHTNGTYTAGAVNGANQTGNTLTVSAITGTFKQGDVITIAGVNAVNRVTKGTTGVLQQFVVTADVAAGSTAIPIYPAIIPSAAGVAVQYQTTDVSPANGALITLIGGAGTFYRKNILVNPEAITLATVDLELPRGVHAAARENYDGISMRMVQQYDIVNDNFITRFDILYGYATVRGEWGVTVPDVA